MNDSELLLVLNSLSNLAFHQLRFIEFGKKPNTASITSICSLYRKLHKDHLCPYSPTISALETMLPQTSPSPTTAQALPS